jgi:hypothetical protein
VFVCYVRSIEQILIEKRDDILGKMIDVVIVKTDKFFMVCGCSWLLFLIDVQEGRILEESIAAAPAQRSSQVNTRSLAVLSLTGSYGATLSKTQEAS